MTLAALFTHPIIMPSWLVLWLILPLCLCVAVVYKTVRIQDIRRLPRSVGIMMAYIAGGLCGLAVVLWLIQLIFA
ncbi:MAG: hypothetical protein GVY16_06895 [Planctomycetes bacterium]|jgi:hypothetical protein|nr:hypothetical protein [Phycisphaerae bacterium]NBB95453.1 hypothetical protein [Planctomycetota bacterium]